LSLCIIFWILHSFNNEQCWHTLLSSLLSTGTPYCHLYCPLAHLIVISTVHWHLSLSPLGCIITSLPRIGIGLDVNILILCARLLFCILTLSTPALKPSLCPQPLSSTSPVPELKPVCLPLHWLQPCLSSPYPSPQAHVPTPACVKHSLACPHPTPLLKLMFLPLPVSTTALPALTPGEGAGQPPELPAGPPPSTGTTPSSAYTHSDKENVTPPTPLTANAPGAGAGGTPSTAGAAACSCVVYPHASIHAWCTRTPGVRVVYPHASTVRVVYPHASIHACPCAMQGCMCACMSVHGDT